MRCIAGEKRYIIIMEKIIKTVKKNQKSELKKISEELKKLKNLKKKYKRNSLAAPRWMDCVWKRVPCGKQNCPICGDSKRHSGKIHSPIEVLEDIENNLKKVLKFIKTDAKKTETEFLETKKFRKPPKPDKFPLYVRARAFRESMLHAAQSAESGGELWVYTEAFQDLMWYMNLFPIKVYRQLCNRWRTEKGEGQNENDYKYIKYVLKECLKILKNSLSIVLSFDSAEKDILMFNAALLMSLEREIKKI